MPFIAISLQFQFPPPSARTTHKPARQSAQQQVLSAVHKALYHGPFSPRDISSSVRACYPPEKRVYRVLRYFDFLGKAKISFVREIEGCNNR